MCLNNGHIGKSIALFGQKSCLIFKLIVDKRKKKHIYHAAEYYIFSNRLENIYCRIDVIEGYIFENITKINHLKNCIFEKPYRKFIRSEEEEFL